MPRGKYTNHKGRARRFTNPDDLEKQRKQDEYKRNRKPKDFDEESESEEEEEKNESSDEEESESEEDESGKAKGIEGLIPIENPNRIQRKAKKLSAINEVLTGAGASGSGSTGPQLSRREREEVDKQRAEAYYKKLHAEGKTEEARADLARLAIIKQQREEAAKKREQEKKLKETAKAMKNVESLKAIGKKQ